MSLADENTGDFKKGFISYSWKQKQLVRNVYGYLQGTNLFGKDGLWLDVNKINDDLYGDIADGIDKADVVISFVSNDYKNSANCKHELTYAYNQKKEIIPVKAQADFQFRGWVGFLLGEKLYVDMSQDAGDEVKLLLANRISEVLYQCKYDEFLKRYGIVVSTQPQSQDKTPRPHVEDNKPNGLVNKKKLPKLKAIPTNHYILPNKCHDLNRTEFCTRYFSGKFWKRSMITYCILLLFGGITLISGGSWALGAYTPRFAPAIAVMTVGGLLILLAGLGSCGTIRESCYLMALYLAFLLLLFCSLVTLAVLFRADQSQFEDSLHRLLLADVNNDYGLLSALHGWYGCCGVDSVVDSNCTLSYPPFEVCHVGSPLCSEGCMPVFWRTVSRFSLHVAAALLVFAAVMIIGMLIAVCMTLETDGEGPACC